MVIERYGIKLKRLRWEDIEMVRMWRNSDEVRKYMYFREKITIEMQKEWFRFTNNDKNFFFVIYDNDYPVGLTEVKHIENGVGDLGIFIADEDVLKSNPLLAYKAVISITDFAFERLELDKLKATILPENTRAKRFNESFGFRLIQAGPKVETYGLSMEDYVRKSQKIRSLLDRK